MGDYPSFPACGIKLRCDEGNCDVCSACVVTCSLMHFGEANVQKTGIRLEARYNDGIAKMTYCRQCDAPGCVQACRVGAFVIDEETGCRRIEQEKCIGCKACMRACPFDAIIYVPETKTCFKCDLCGGDPECVKQCPTGCLTAQTKKRRA